jgi:prepilin-type N-terminal cleavage/methylation domain-containing protein
MKIARPRYFESLVRGKITMKKEAGFTLVEIAIVLVVIGLLLGAILAGQEVVLNGQIRNTVNEYNNVASAVFVYQDRYRQIPGDDSTAAARWPGTNAVGGNGDRQIDGTWDATAAVAGTSEGGIFWHHLRNDELVAGARDSTAAGAFALPLNAFNGEIGVQEGAFGAPGAGTMTDTVICQSNIPFKAAVIIDARIDDDDGSGSGSATGSVQAGDHDNSPATNAAPVGIYSEANGPDFILCRELG